MTWGNRLALGFRWRDRTGALAGAGAQAGVHAMTVASNLRINSERLWDTLMEMAKIGPGIAGGNNRQTLTPEDAEGR
ncbi:MAG: hypothetical protein P8N43_06140, partial [Alphaproteobacteria bacterium]|nr:hypothetical protein [Alphaproteobacteria bacterium]